MTYGGRDTVKNKHDMRDGWIAFYAYIAQMLVLNFWILNVEDLMVLPTKNKHFKIPKSSNRTAYSLILTIDCLWFIAAILKNISIHKSMRYINININIIDERKQSGN